MRKPPPTAASNAKRKRRKAIQDARLERRAVRDRWPIPTGKRLEIAERTVKRALAKDDRTATDATRNLLEMERINQADRLAREKNNRLDTGKATERVAIEPVQGEWPPLPGAA